MRTSIEKTTCDICLYKLNYNPFQLDGKDICYSCANKIERAFSLGLAKRIVEMVRQNYNAGCVVGLDKGNVSVSRVEVKGNEMF